jgi:hypothetical protein
MVAPGTAAVTAPLPASIRSAGSRRGSAGSAAPSTATHRAWDLVHRRDKLARTRLQRILDENSGLEQSFNWAIDPKALNTGRAQVGCLGRLG